MEREVEGEIGIGRIANESGDIRSLGYIVPRQGKRGILYYAVFKNREGTWVWEAVKPRARNEREAYAYLNKKEKEVEAKTYGRRRILFSDYADEWLGKVEGTVKPSTLEAYAGIIRKHLKPFFGKKHLDEIDSDTCERYKNKKKKEVSPTTVNRTLQVLNMILKDALGSRPKLITDNPLDTVKRLREAPRSHDTYTADEILRLLEAIPPRYLPLYMTAVITGAREGELFALKWKNVDLVRGYIHIEETWSPEWGFTDPKSQSAIRYIRIPPYLSRILKAHYQSSERTGREDVVFPSQSKEPNAPIRRQNLLRRVHYPAIEKAGLPKRNFHDLRHACGTLLHDIGMPDASLSQQFGHSKTSTTKDIYTHPVKQTVERYGEELERVIFGDAEKESPDSAEEDTSSPASDQ